MNERLLMTNNEVSNLAKWLAIKVTEQSIKSQNGDDLAKIEALETTLNLLYDFISRIDENSDGQIITKTLGEIANIKNGAQAQFIKRYVELENRAAKPRQQLERAILVCAQEILQKSGMTLKAAREFIAKRTDYTANQLEEHRKRIKSKGLNTAKDDEIEAYQQFMKKYAATPTKETAVKLIESLKRL